MAPEFQAVYTALKPVLAAHADRLAVQSDGPTGYTLVTRTPSPFPQHKGEPMYFGAIHVGKAYVSFHLIALYMNTKLAGTISPALKKRMQGKSCFNFKKPPEPELLAELERLTQAGVDMFSAMNWL